MSANGQCALAEARYKSAKPIAVEQGRRPPAHGACHPSSLVENADSDLRGDLEIEPLTVLLQALQPAEGLPPTLHALMLVKDARRTAPSIVNPR
jgi:hypothetical protein